MAEAVGGSHCGKSNDKIDRPKRIMYFFTRTTSHGTD